MVAVMEVMVAVVTGASDGPSVTQRFAQPRLELDASLSRSPKAKRLLSEAFLLSS